MAAWAGKEALNFSSMPIKLNESHDDDDDDDYDNNKNVNNSHHDEKAEAYIIP